MAILKLEAVFNVSSVISYKACLVGEIRTGRGLINHMSLQVTQIVHFLFGFSKGFHI